MKNNGLRGKFIKIRNPEESTGSRTAKTAIKLATGFSRNLGFWLCNTCTKNRWNKNEPVHMRVPSGEIYSYTKN